MGVKVHVLGFFELVLFCGGVRAVVGWWWWCWFRQPCFCCRRRDECRIGWGVGRSWKLSLILSWFALSLTLSLSVRSEPVLPTLARLLLAHVSHLASTRHGLCSQDVASTRHFLSIWSSSPTNRHHRQHTKSTLSLNFPFLSFSKNTHTHTRWLSLSQGWLNLTSSTCTRPPLKL